MGLLYVITNLVDGATITSTSEDSLFPHENLYDGRPSRPFKFDAAAADDYVTFDLGSAQNVDFASIHGHNIDSGITAIRLYSKATAFTASPTDGTLEATLTKRNPAFYTHLSSPVNRRYWRVVFEGTNGSAIQLGELVLGVASTLTKDPRMPSQTIERRRQIRNETRAGEISIVNLTDFPDREVTFQFRGIKSAVDDFRENLWEACNHGADPVVIVPNDAELEVIFGTLSQDIGVLRLDISGSSWFYEYEITLGESSFGVAIST